MFDDIEKRLQKLRGEEVRKKGKVSETSGNTEITEKTTFEQKLRKKIKEGGIVEVFEREDGTLRMHPVQIMEKWFFLSLCANAVLFVLLLTNILGLW